MQSSLIAVQQQQLSANEHILNETPQSLCQITHKVLESIQEMVCGKQNAKGALK